MMSWKNITFAVFFLLTLMLIHALSFTSSPAWSPSLPFTNDTLNCSWDYSADTLAQNITVLNGSAVFTSAYQNASMESLNRSMLVASTNTNKNEQWWCRVILYNESTSTMLNTSVTIRNSPPTTESEGAGIFNDSNEDVGFTVLVPEDATINLDVNATDNDEDTLTYLALGSEEICERTSQTLGTYTCSPTQDDIENNLPTLINVTFTVTDGQNVGGRTVTFNVTPVNDPPNVTLTNQTTPVNASLNYTFTVFDEEGSYPLSYVMSSDPEMDDKLSIVRLNSSGTFVSIYYDATAPDFNDIGIHSITVNITDNSTDYNGQNDSQTVSFSFSLNVTAVGRKPHFTNITPTGPYSISQGEFIQINISANDIDANTTINFFDNTARFNITTTKNNTNGSDATAHINFTPTNDDVGFYNVTITIIDAELQTNTTVLIFNVSDLNEQPTVQEFSYSAFNTLNNQNASNLTAFENAPFIYDVNATDPDSIHGDTLTYSDNTSLFDINATTGRISFTPNSGQVSGTPYAINVTVLDAAGLVANRTIFLVINANNAPFFNQSLTALSCTTKALCARELAQYAEDPDGGDSITLYNVTITSGNLSSFAMNNATGLINFTVLKTEVGNYTLNVSITDSFGASNTSLMTLNINNTPEAPNLTRFNFSNETVVETHLFTYEFRAIDEDFLVSSANEAVNFTTNLSLTHTITPLATSNTTARALFSITPDLGDAGNYSVQINATDAFGLLSQHTVILEVLAQVPPPNITNITPWGVSPNFNIQTSRQNSSLFPSNTVTVNATENLSILFAVGVNDTRPVTYNWTVNGTQNATTANITLPFGFFSSGSYTIRVNVSNDRFESTTWTWTLLIENVNREPQLINPLENRTNITTAFLSPDYFVGGLTIATVRFYDPDDDLDGDGVIDDNETNTLVFTQETVCAAATLLISSADLTITPLSVESCNVVFNATDPSGATLASNTVLINVTDVPEGEIETPTTSSGGGGGGSTPISRFLPLDQNKNKPEAFHLIAPRLVTVYDNESLVIPITVNNTWHETLHYVQLHAETNATEVDAQLDITLFEEIPVNESRDVQLIVKNYRLGENYEVLVRGNVSDPAYEDEAIILLNSIEQSSSGSDVEVKVTFANDLVNEHPECQELNELLRQAEQKLAQNDYKEAERMVDAVINGCKYLVSTEQRQDERPSRINPLITIDNVSVKTIMFSVLVFVIMLSIALLLYYHYSYKPEEDI